MKKVLIGLVVLGLLAIGAYSMFGGDEMPQEDLEASAVDAVSVDDGTYTVAPASTITWMGRKPLLANYEDVGTVSAKSGEFAVVDGVLDSGLVVFDMNTISATKTGSGGGESGLTTHLKSADFFNVAEHPEAVFVVTDVREKMASSTNYEIVGTLTMKGIIQPVTFPAQIEVLEDGRLRVVAETVIDRTLWDVRFGSGKFFENLADNVIADDVTISFDLALLKQ